jgi:predicted GNAT family N-acyltransferase
MIERVGQLSEEQWAELADGEQDPFGVAGDTTEWRRKTQHSTLRDGGGRLIASVGLVIADVTAGGERFPVAGVGGVIVTWEHRGHGHLRPVLEDALNWAATLETDRAMLWCAEKNVSLYSRFGFLEIAAPVTVDQSGGEAVMPMPAMWRPLRAGVTWPDGDVRVNGLPF